MNLPSATPTKPSSTGFLLWAAVLLMVCVLSSDPCCGFTTFGFEMHHRFSDRLKGILDVGDLPEKGSLQYYAAMAKRDRAIHGRRLASTEGVDQTPLTFSNGNDSYSISALGYLLYANVSVGTPSLSYLVALDTGSDLFWLPCDCISCVRGLKTSAGEVIEFNIYNPNTSSTSGVIPCDSSYCYQRQRQKCSTAADECLYQVSYLSNGTSTTGVLVEDVLHLVTDNDKLKAVGAKIRFGCGRVQTGTFLDGAAPNGLFGLGMTNISVPSTLAREGVAANSFSMCFGPDGVGRIRFGDKGSYIQGETPFNLETSHPTYNISITRVNIGKSAIDLKFNAIFDSGTSFTYLNDPAYTQITDSFSSLVKEKRYSSSDSGIPFEYCFELSQNQSSIQLPDVNLTMQGGNQFSVNRPIELIHLVDYGIYVYCLAIVKSGDVNIIGQNFMTGYQIVFNNEKLALGWKASNCYDIEDSTTLPIKPTNSSSSSASSSSPSEAPTVSFNPEETSGNRSGEAPGTLPLAPPPPMSSHCWRSSDPLSSTIYTIMIATMMMIVYPIAVVF